MQRIAFAAVTWTLLSTTLLAQNPFELKSRQTGGFDTLSVLKDTPIQSEPIAAAPSEIPQATLPIDSVEKSDIPEDTLSVAELPVVADTIESPLRPEESIEKSLEIFEEIEPMVPKEISSPGVMSRISTLLNRTDLVLPQPNAVTSQNLLFGLTIFVLVLLAVLMVLNRMMLRNTYRAMSNDNYLRFLLREAQNRPWIYRLFYLLFFINFGFFIFLTATRSTGDATSWILLPVGILLVLVIYLIRHLVLFILGNTFPVSKETELFGFMIMLINIAIGILLTPINIGLAFGPDWSFKYLIIIGLVLIVFLYIFRQFKGLFISSRLMSGYKFHFFLYFCIVELAPLLVIGKLANTHM